MDLVETLRPMRKALVMAAEKVATEMFTSGGVVSAGGKLTIAKTQLNHLVGVCGEATCAEEIENYLRYQAGRKGTGWTPALVDKVIAEISSVVAGIEHDPQRVAAWRLYAIFLTRAYTYQAETHKYRTAGGADMKAQASARQSQHRRAR